MVHGLQGKGYCWRWAAVLGVIRRVVGIERERRNGRERGRAGGEDTFGSFLKMKTRNRNLTPCTMKEALNPFFIVVKIHMRQNLPI